MDLNTREFSLTTIDKDTYKPGLYKLRITGTVTGDLASVSDSEVIKIRLVDPCPTTTLTLNNLSPITGPIQYTLRDGDLDTPWSSSSPSELLTKDTLVDCGAPTYEIVKDNGKAIQTAIFSDVQDGAGNNIFRVIDQTDPNRAGDYFFKIKAYFADYPRNKLFTD